MTTRRSRGRRALATLLAVAVAGGSPALAVVAAPPAPATAAPAAGTKGQAAAYPVQTVLREPPPDPTDASLRAGLTPYHDLVRRLNDLQDRSDRVGVEVVGGTPRGRELYLVTVTTPETEEQARAQDRFREEITADPVRAAQDADLARDYKLPFFVSANIHGDEWEGTDAALRLVEEYATSDDPTVLRRLEKMRIHVLVTANPDGRVAGTRENSAGFDLNRDLVTTSQPETVALRDAIVRTQPVLLLDLHGYVNGTLLDPTTPPHGENYEYDLFLEHAWPNALGMERAIKELGYTPDRDGVHPPQIPLRDWGEGWDDWPPIFTPQYAALHGAVAHTVELPLRVNREASTLPEAELRRRAGINTDIAVAAVEASLAYAETHRRALLADHIEVFRRGVTGEPPRSAALLDHPHVRPEDVVTTEYPRAYLIPVGSGQRSEVAAARLVGHLVDNGVEVHRTREQVTVGSRRYPAGSYVVDLHQARRGMARAILGPGSDLSDRVQRMYDVAGWSHGLLWGADVVTVPAGTELPGGLERVSDPAPTGGVAGSADLVLPLDDPAEVAALAELLGEGAEAELLDRARVLVPGADRDLAAELADRHGVRFHPAPAGADGEPLEPVTVAAVATAEDRWVLSQLGFDVVPVDAAVLDNGFDWSQVDVLYVADRLAVGALGAEARAALEDFLDDGGGLVAQGALGADLNRRLDLLDVTAVTGTTGANGVVAVVSGTGPVGARATPHTFVEAPVWFTGLAEDVAVDQRLAADPLVSGHWRATAGAGGPDDAAGRPLVVHGTDESGARVVLFGSDPLFRDHAKGQQPLVARALLWASAGAG